MPPSIADLSDDHCHVLVVDDDQATVEEYIEIAGSLGYSCVSANDPATALRMMAENPGIGIVMTDFQMPGIDGLTFLEELSTRFSAVRPIVTLLVTGFGSLDVAVEAMRQDASDMLVKPISRHQLAEALRRASGRWLRLLAKHRLAALSASTRSPATPDARAAADRSGPSEQDLLALVRDIVRGRDQRAEYIDKSLFSDPSWDILLDLTSAALVDMPVPVSSACQAAQVPISTGLRYVRGLVEAGHVRRWRDPADKRRDLLALEPATRSAMIDYLTAIWKRRNGKPA